MFNKIIRELALTAQSMRMGLRCTVKEFCVILKMLKRFNIIQNIGNLENINVGDL